MIAIVLGYGVLFVIFDTQATLFEVAPGVSLWYPSAGLNLALVLVFGVWYTPAIFVALMASGLWISEPGLPVHHLILPNLVIAVGNGGVAWILRRALADRTLAAPGGLVRVVAAMAGLAAWNAVTGPMMYLMTGLDGYSLDSISSTMFKWWIADWAGMLILTPALLVGAVVVGVHSLPTAWTRGLVRRLPGSLTDLFEVAGQGAAVVLSLYAAFELFDGPYLLYLCFLPVLWMALRHGIAGGAVGVLLVNLGAALVLSSGRAEPSILGLQLFIVALALTGLVVGALVSERQHAVDMLREGLESGAATPSTESSGASTDNDVLRVANRMQSKHRKLAEDADWLLQQNRRKDQLFGIIAHDLQGAVGTAAGLANVVDTEADSLPRDTLATFGRRLRDSIERAQALLDNLLNWAQVHLEEGSTRSGEASVEEITAAAVVYVEPEADEKGVAIDRRVPPELRVRGDATLLQAVIRNLLSNAIKFSDEGERVVVSAEAGEDAATLCVRDRGVGVPPNEIDSLFEPGETVSRRGTEGEEGTGLGLVLCREIVEHHGGRIWAERPEGGGTRVCFTLPLPADEGGTEIGAPQAGVEGG